MVLYEHLSTTMGSCESLDENDSCKFDLNMHQNSKHYPDLKINRSQIIFKTKRLAHRRETLISIWDDENVFIWKGKPLQCIRNDEIIDVLYYTKLKPNYKVYYIVQIIHESQLYSSEYC